MWDFISNTHVIEIKVSNTLLDKDFPRDSGTLAITDTGYSGFLYVPTRLFRRLQFHKLKTKTSSGTLTDGSSARLSGAFGAISFSALDGLTVEGFIETSEGAREVLIGMEGIRNLFISLDCCQGMTRAQECN